MIITLQERHIAKPDAKKVITYLKETLGARVRMITGDNKHSAYRVAKYLGID
jgi:cation transport ATPase